MIAKTYTQTDRQTDRQTGLIRLLQYVYGFAFVRLGDIGKVSMCKRIMKADTTNEGDIPFYKIGTFGKKADAFIKKDKYEEFISEKGRCFNFGCGNYRKICHL